LPANDLPPGTKLGSYRIMRPLGRGGMGAVYEARDEGVGRAVALKVLGRDLAQDDRFMERFRREGRAAGSISHPNIVAVFFVGEERGTAYMALELLAGGSLGDRLAKTGSIPWREVATLGAQIARALAAVHAAGLVHRDVKPANILLDSQGNAKLADFGLVRRDVANPGTSAALTRTGELLGSFEFISPEQADGAPVEARSDLYSFGATLHALLAGSPPFAGSGMGLMKAHLMTPPPSVRATVPGVPESFARLVLSMLAKSPAGRPGSALEVAEELEAIARSTAPSGGKRGVGVAVASVAILAIAGAAVALGLPGSGAASKPPLTPRVTPPVTPPPPARSVEPPAPKPEAKAPLRLVTRWSFAPAHAAKVCQCTFSPDGKRALTTSGDQTLKYWDVAAGELLATLVGHEAASWRAAFSADGDMAVSSGYDGTIRTWSVRAARDLTAPLRTISVGHVGPVEAVAISPDGHFVLAGDGDDGIVRAWNLSSSSDEPVTTFAGHGPGVTSVAFAPDGRTALSGDKEGKIFSWPFMKGGTVERPDRRAEIAKNFVVDFALSPDRKSFLSANWGGRDVSRWRLADLSLMQTYGTHRQGVGRCAFSSDGKEVLSGSCDDRIMVWDAASGDVVFDSKGTGTWETGTTFGFAGDGKRILRGDLAGNVSLLELVSGP
jgi:WD40 repeat protein